MNPTPVSSAELQILLSSYDKNSKFPPKASQLEKKHDLDFPGETTNQYKMVSFLMHNPEYSFSKEDLSKIAEHLDVISSDIIQTVNKVEQWGLKRWAVGIKGKRYYAMPTIEYNGRTHRKKALSLTKKDLADRVKISRRYFRALSEEKFEKGHKDPCRPLTEDNFTMQPQSINRSYRDRYIFDDNGLPKVPNPRLFANNPLSYYKSQADVDLITKGLIKTASIGKLSEMLRENLSDEDRKVLSEYLS